MSTFKWKTAFLSPCGPSTGPNAVRRALIILNQPFSLALLQRLWAHSTWYCCADGGANRLHDVLHPSPTKDADARLGYLPNLIKGDLDSLRDDVREYYASQGVPVVQDHDQNSTDLMKCLEALVEKEQAEGGKEYEVVLLGGLSGRLDQTVHTLSFLHKLRKKRKRVFAVTEENVGWVLDEGEHLVEVDHAVVGPTCGLLPVGVDSATVSTRGLRWNLDEQESGFDGLVSTSNHLSQELRS